MTAQEFKMVGYFAKVHELRPQLSTPPVIRFKDNKDALLVYTLKEIESSYKTLLKEAAKARARDKRLDKD